MDFECALQRFACPSAKALVRKSGELDFKDVFGGPPRRFSMQEVRRGNGWSEASEEEDRLSPLGSAVREKTVFGEDTEAKRRMSSGDFFDDIFGGAGDGAFRSPRSLDRDNLLGRSPNSAMLSPTTPKSESSGTSSLSQFSSYYKMDGSINALISPRSTAPLSRFSNQAILREDEIKSEAYFCRQSSLPSEPCFKCEDLLYNNVMHNEKKSAEKSKKDMKSIDENSNWSHSSIYRWAAGRGILLIRPFMSRNSMKSKDRIGKCASLNGRRESKLTIMGNGGSLHTKPEHLEVESEGRYLGSLDTEKEQQISLQECVLSAGDACSRVRQNMTLKRRILQKKIGMTQKNVDEVPMTMKESLKSEAKPTLGSVLLDEAKQKGNGEFKEESKTATPKKSQSDVSNADFLAQNESNRWKAKSIDQNEKLCEVLKKDEAQPCYQRKKNPIIESDSDSFCTIQKATSSFESLPCDSMISVESSACSFEDNFTSVDAQIQQWHVERKGNIRALLSTLQYVLWPGSGWNPVPLVDLVEAHSVKRAYQKALLRLHPDKLQQTGAASHRKYAAEKIFEILQEAWDDFNTTL